MTGALLLLLVIAPALAVLGCLVARPDQAANNLATGVVVFAAAVPLTMLVRLPSPTRSRRAGSTVWRWWCSAARASGLLSMIYAVGYMRLLGEDQRLPSFYALYAGFALTILISPLMNNAALYWIAIELTTLVSTFLVAFERAPGRHRSRLEIHCHRVDRDQPGIARHRAVLLERQLCARTDLQYDLGCAARCRAEHEPDLTVLAFLLVLVGYGTGVGLAPMHTLASRCAQRGPGAGFGVLSGALLNAAMLGIVRYLAITERAPSGRCAAGPGRARRACPCWSRHCSSCASVASSG